jgi:hypothetical protein
MIANWETSRSDIPAQMIPLLAFALNVKVTDLLPDLRKSAASSFATNKRADSKNKKAKEKGSGAGWFLLKARFVKKVLAPVFGRFPGPPQKRIRRKDSDRPTGPA